MINDNALVVNNGIFKSRWGSLHPIAIKSWRNKWHNLFVYFKQPEDMRRHGQKGDTCPQFTLKIYRNLR